MNKVIDAQISRDIQTVGNCFGLILLHNWLLGKIRIVAEALYLENAFGIGPHVITILGIRESLIDIENILADGFDYKGHLDNPLRTRWGIEDWLPISTTASGINCFQKVNLSGSQKTII